MFNDSLVTVYKEDINSKLPDKFIYICFASFEERSITISLSLNKNHIINTTILRGVNIDNQFAVNKICDRIDDCKIIDLNLNKPTAVAKILTGIIKGLSSFEGTSLVIDITTFTHETLTMLLKLVYDNKKKFASIICLYNGASDYSNSKVDGFNQMWLSKGCRDVRNVIGFPGLMRPASKTCLVILTGFELERTTRLIELLEPDKIVLGKGIDVIHPNHKSTIKHFHNKFEEWEENYKHGNCINISFSCKDIQKTVSILVELISRNPDDNYILVPLNTKLSTIATTIVALHNSKIQICYAAPEMYNTKNYSSPDNNITIVELNKIEMFQQ